MWLYYKGLVGVKGEVCSGVKDVTLRRVVEIGFVENMFREVFILKEFIFLNLKRIF